MATIATLQAPRKLVWVTEPMPAAPPHDQILCRTLVSAISPGTELAAFVGAPPIRDCPAYPRVQGYCNVSEVLALGQGVKGLSVSERILTFQSHRSHFVIPRRDVLLVIPNDVPSDVASVLYIFHLGYNSVLRSNVRLGCRVAVIGLGALGLASVAAAHLAGAQVLGISNHLTAQHHALTYGSNYVSSREDACSRENWADVVIITTNTWSDWHLAMTLAQRMATVAVLGFPGRESPPGDFNPLASKYFYDKQLRLEAVGVSPETPNSRGFLRFNERDNLQFLLELVQEKRLDASRIISGRFPAQSLEAAYQALLDRTGSPVTYVLEWKNA